MYVLVFDYGMGNLILNEIGGLGYWVFIGNLVHAYCYQNIVRI